MAKSLVNIVHDEAEMLELGSVLASVIPPVLTVIFLQGPLGAGKTTLVRGVLRSLGHTGKVKSPTYTLVEPYTIANRSVFHFDFYRVEHPQELEHIGVGDYFVAPALCLVEWPDKAAAVIPPADIICYLEFHSAGRQVTIEAHSAAGEAVIVRLRSSRSNPY